MYAPSSLTEPLRQGEILSDVIQIRLNLDTNDPYENPVIDPIPHPYAIVATQDCDLDWDFKVRSEIRATGRQILSEGKIIRNVLLCEAGIADGFRTLPSVNSELWRQMKKNKHDRYHFLGNVVSGQDLCNEGIPELGVDFKRYFTVPTDELYFGITSKRIKRRCRLVNEYLQQFIQRFYYYQSRVAVP